MIVLRDRVRVEVQEQTGEDSRGDPTYDWVDHGSYPADVQPLNTDEVISYGRDAVIARYKMLLAASADLPAAASRLRLTWRGSRFNAEGDVMVRSLAGRTHHYEIVGKRVTG